jgi:purine-binding chemotaxis protein CheW
MSQSIRQSSAAKNIQSEDEANDPAFLLFVAGGEVYGTKITDVREVIAPLATKAISDTSSWVKGIVNLRGEVLVAVDLRERLKLAAPASRGYMVIETERGPMALIVDRIHSVIAFKPEEIQDRSHIQIDVKNEYFLGVGKQGSETALLLDLKRIFTEENLIQNDPVTKEAREK